MKQKPVFRKSFLESLLNGFKATGLTEDSTVLLLQELVFHTNKNILVTTENQESSFGLYGRGQEHDSSVFTYFPESKGENSVPGFEKENVRHQKESVLKTTEPNGVVCIGTPLSFEEKIVLRQHKNNIKKLDIFVGLKLDREKLISFLENVKYRQVGLVENPSEYNFRGDVVDFFPPFFKNPIRVSFLFNEVESICVFDPENQQPAGNLKKATVKELVAPQAIDNINLIEHAKEHHFFHYETTKGELVLLNKDNKQHLLFSFSMVSAIQELNHKNKPALFLF